MALKTQDHKVRLQKIKKILQKQKIDFFILPNKDEFFLEYLPESEKRIEYLSGFTGSNATIIVSQKKSFFFTDGRYILQAKNELDLQDYKIFDIVENSSFSWLESNLKKSQKIAIDIKLSSINFVKKLEKICDDVGAKLVFIDQNPVDEIWNNRPKKINSKIFSHNLKYSGVDSANKIKTLTKNLKHDAIFFSHAESICWLLNIRARDTEFSPLLATYAVLLKSGKVILFVDEKRLEKNLKQKLEHVVFVSELLPLPLRERDGARVQIKTIQLDFNLTNFAIYKSLKNFGLEIHNKQDPVLIKKACKNKIEIKNAIKAHEIDGLAVTRFLFWLENSIKNGVKIDELKAEEKLLEFRKKNQEFLYPSFRSISAFASNGAIIHYHAAKKTNKEITKNSLYLIDSGGQYYQGTTDITRTIAIGKPTKEMRQNFTLVLKGHIALALTKFNDKTTGSDLDKIARKYLNLQKKDYPHGTGHGVGSFLSVHEGPSYISKNATKQTFQAGMILSNEPGFYQENKYGIRIENLVLINKINDYLAFETLTLAPIDPKLIDVKILTKKEKKWLLDYHKKVFATFLNHLSEQEKSWLDGIFLFYKNIF